MKGFQFVILFLFCNLHSIQSQNSGVYLGVDVPLYYSLGYQQQLSSQFSVDGQVGLLTKPFDKLILNTMKMFDVNEVLLNTIGDKFSWGFTMQAKINWHIKKSYIGLTYSYLLLKVKGWPGDELQSYSAYEFLLSRYHDITLTSQLHNAGLLYGRVFNFANPRYSVRLELSVLKTFYSKTVLKDNDGDELSRLSEIIDRELDEYYLEYGFLPSLNIYFMYKFGMKK
jgi:hypothetical protein